MTDDEILDREVATLVRQWDVTPADARDAILQLRRQEARLGREIARDHAWTTYPTPRAPVEIDLRDPVLVR